MTDYKALAERVITADGHAITSWFESGEERITCEALKQRQIEAVAAVLKEALTPEWKDVPDKLPEGAARGAYSIKYEGIYNQQLKENTTVITSHVFERAEIDEFREQKTAKGVHYMLLAAFDANDNPVANPMRNSMSGAHKEA
jgi:hypothetical protein